MLASVIFLSAAFMNTPTHAEIAGQAEHLWRSRGCPVGRDSEIWLEAERQLRRDLPSTGDQKPGSFTERVKEETAAESVVEYQISPAGSVEDAIGAAMQKSDSRIPKTKPHQTGKPSR